MLIFVLLFALIPLIIHGHPPCLRVNGGTDPFCYCHEDFIVSCKVTGLKSPTHVVKVLEITASNFDSNFAFLQNLQTENLAVHLSDLKIGDLGGFATALADYSKYILNNFTLQIQDLDYLKPSELMNRGIPTLCEKKHKNQNLYFNISKSFAKSGESYFNIEQLTINFSRIAVSQLTVPLLVNNYLNLTNVMKFTIANTPFYWDLNFVYISQKCEQCYHSWEAQTFFPQFYQNQIVESSNNPLSMNLAGTKSANFMHKEVFQYVKSIKITYLSEFIDRIEYGTFALPEKIKQFFCLDSSQNCDVTEVEALFLEGECEKLNQTLCEICLMHQYGMHRTNDNVALRCERREKVDRLMVKCFWRDVQPIPSSMRSLNIDRSWNDESVKPCKSIPFDVAMFIRLLNNASSSENKPSF